MRFSNQERRIFKQGYQVIGGIDEAGRGPLAGPVTAAIVLVDQQSSAKLRGYQLKDSKQLTAKQREEIFEKIKQNFEYKISFISSQVIDKINIWQATQLAWKRCLQKLKPDYLFLDGNHELKNLKIPQQAIIKGDEKILAVSLASIVAKVSRDRLMERLDKKYPEYGFRFHKGYGTKLHLEKIKKYGSCLIHRKSFKPILKNP